MSAVIKMQRPNAPDQCEALTEAMDAILFAARQGREAVAEMDQQKIRVWLSTIGLTVAAARKMLGEGP